MQKVATHCVILPTSKVQKWQIQAPNTQQGLGGRQAMRVLLREAARLGTHVWQKDYLTCHNGPSTSTVEAPGMLPDMIRGQPLQTADHMTRKHRAAPHTPTPYPALQKGKRTDKQETPSGTWFKCIPWGPVPEKASTALNNRHDPRKSREAACKLKLWRVVCALLHSFLALATQAWPLQGTSLNLSSSLALKENAWCHTPVIQHSRD